MRALPDSTQEALRTLFNDAMRAHGVNTVQLAVIMEKHRTYVQNVLSGRKYMTINFAQECARALNLFFSATLSIKIGNYPVIKETLE